MPQWINKGEQGAEKSALEKLVLTINGYTRNTYHKYTETSDLLCHKCNIFEKHYFEGDNTIVGKKNLASN